ncbi:MULTISPECIES: helix-turn-helix domain-containing protein [unclassified Butyrivibrio]|jgi:transcriptional regulator with XRE-family HTH domain|uniref:helix-turn-helix domain-containing protein n=1 Tax=unclassified Butyrivibrio TaxID=2639466 RepID=UPI00047CC6D7|nr:MULTISPECIES: helix-turn-helix domain-containing protein [unclassified Butyrivibrio]
MDNDNEKIANKLRELRSIHGYTQSYIAANIDVKQPTYQQYEAGKRTPSIISLYKLANFYGLTTDELLKLCVPLDNEIYFDAPDYTSRTLEEAELSSFKSDSRHSGLNNLELQLLYYFSKLDKESKNELIEFAQYKVSKLKH